jgi:hypothetical protein
MRRWVRWGCLTLCLGCLAKIIAGRGEAVSVAGFFVTGAVWYYLTWRRTRELDSPQPFRAR